MKQALFRAQEPQGTFNESICPQVDPSNTLIVGDISRWTQAGRDTADFDNFFFVTLNDLTLALLHEHAPQIILSPLFADGFDALDVATRLHALGFEGRYRVLARDVPQLEIICNEVAQVAPGLDFDLLDIPHAP